jgi:hypothetical protein
MMKYAAHYWTELDYSLNIRYNAQLDKGEMATYTQRIIWLVSSILTSLFLFCGFLYALRQ